MVFLVMTIVNIKDGSKWFLKLGIIDIDDTAVFPR